ncbi:hypothetical protein ACOSQ2_026766 [Xanthoceras sorbifolium]
MSGSGSQRLREDRGAEASVSSRQRARLLSRGALRAIAVVQVDNLDQPGEVNVVNAAYRGICRKNGTFSSLPSRIYRGDLKVMADSFRFPSGHQMLVSTVTDKAAYSPSSFIAISRHHLIARLRFLILRFLIDLILSSYGHLLTIYLSFRRNEIPPPSDNGIRYYFILKQCPLAKGLLEDALHDGMHYLSVWAGECKELLQRDSNLNVENYKANYLFAKGSEIELLRTRTLSFSRRRKGCLMLSKP